MIEFLRNEAEKNIDMYRGQPGLKASDLLELPGIPDEGTNWGVYLGCEFGLCDLPAVSPVNLF